MSMEQLSLFDHQKISQPLSQPHTSGGSGRIRGPGASGGEGEDSPADAGYGSDYLHDILGASGCGENHAGKDYREYDTGVIYRFQRCHKRNQRDQGRDEAGGGRQAIGP